ncbi:MAG: CBS domain-containing protein [Gemmatimonadaceae bacterium]|nr:CBS domain-containing protein [Gemmatimonadaceae bacterium]
MLKLRNIMTTDVVSVTPLTTLRDAMELLARRHVSGAPVLQGDKVVGVVSASDLIGFAASQPGVPTEQEEPGDTEWRDWSDLPVPDVSDAEDEPSAEFFTDLWDDAGAEVTERMASVEGPEWNVLEEHEVREVMTRRLWALKPGDAVEQAAELMSRAGIHRVLVVDEGALVGIVTGTDIARAVAEGKVQARTYVFNRDREFREPWS